MDVGGLGTGVLAVRAALAAAFCLSLSHPLRPGRLTAGGASLPSFVSFFGLTISSREANLSFCVLPSGGSHETGSAALTASAR